MIPYSHSDQTSLLAFVIGITLVWSITLFYRLFLAKIPWFFSEILLCDLFFCITCIRKSFEFIIETLFYTSELVARFWSSRLGWSIIVVLSGIIGYAAPWETYNLYLAPGHTRIIGPSVGRSGVDELLLGQIMHHIFTYEKIPGIIGLGLLIFIVPRQGIRRDKLVRWVHRHRLFGTFRASIQFVKFMSWFFIICFIFYVTVV